MYSEQPSISCEFLRLTGTHMMHYATFYNCTFHYV